MSEWLFRRGQEMVLGTLQYGQVPKHIAFIMDGNNRFARQHNLEILEAHNLGLETLSNVSRSDKTRGKREKKHGVHICIPTTILTG